jgi:hypothetical protein
MSTGGNDMKNLITLLLVAVISLSVCGCVTQGVNNGTNTGEVEQNIGSEVTADKVMSSKESPASDFQYWESEEGIVISAYNGSGGIVVIPEKIDGVDVVRIGEKAFVNEDTITAVKLSDTVREVGDHAFENCYGMKVFISGKSLKRLGEYALNYCVDLEVVKLNDGLEVLAPCAIESFALREIEIPSTVTKMDSALAGTQDRTLVLIGEKGSYVEQFVAEKGKVWYLEFRAK